MFAFKRTALGAVLFVAFFTICINPIFPVTPTYADSWLLGPVSTEGTLVVGQALAVQATFAPPANAGATYLLDTEVYLVNSSTKVAQWTETLWLDGGQTITRNYAWQTSGLAAGAYVFKQGVFSPDWSNNYSWNNQSGSLNLVAATDPTNTNNLMSTSTTASTSNSSFRRGVNLAGAEFGENNLPGIYGVDYTYPTSSELDYYKNKGFNLIRLPFRWERVQPNLWGDLNTVELGRIDNVVAAAQARGMQVILDPHNYARYKMSGTEYLIGSSQVPTAAFADFWTKLAAHYNGETAIYAYSLMNEPHDTNGTWTNTAQVALNAIRQSDTAHLILVPGDGWAGAWTWNQNNPNLWVNDPSNNVEYEAHQYFDSDGSGSYNQSYEASGAYPNIGVDRLQPFLNWLKAHNARGIVTEYGVPNNDPRWLTVLDNFLSALDNAGISGTYWAGGPWWGNYLLSSEPVNGQDAAVMPILTNHLGKN